MSKPQMTDEDVMANFELVGHDLKIESNVIDFTASEPQESIQHDYVVVDKVTLSMSIIEVPENEDANAVECDWTHVSYTIEDSIVEHMEVCPLPTTLDTTVDSHANVGPVTAPFEMMEPLASAPAISEAENFSGLTIDDASALYDALAPMIEECSDESNLLKDFGVDEPTGCGKSPPRRPSLRENQRKYEAVYRAKVKAARERILPDWIDGELSLRRLTATRIAVLSLLRGENDTMREEVRQLLFEEHAILQDTFEMRALIGLSTGLKMLDWRRGLHIPGCKRDHMHELMERRTAFVFHWYQPEEQNEEEKEE